MLSSIYTSSKEDTVVNNNQSLRGCLEEQAITLNEEFLNSLSGLQHRFQVLQDEISYLSNVCTEMKYSLVEAKKDTRGVVQKTKEFNLASESLEMKYKISAAFVKKFQLSVEEKEILAKDYENDICGAFYKALQRSRDIYKLAKSVLLDQHQVLSLEIMGKYHFTTVLLCKKKKKKENLKYQ